MKNSFKTDVHRELIEQCKQGKSMSQYKLYNKYVDAMYNVSYNMLNNQHDAEDAIQISFANAFNHIERFDYSSTFGAWLKRIVINNSINILKKNNINFSGESEILKAEVAVEVTEPKYPYNIAQVMSKIAALPDGYRIVLTLYLIEGYDHTEIADILNVSVSTSKTQYSRAKKKLKEILITA